MQEGRQTNWKALTRVVMATLAILLQALLMFMIVRFLERTATLVYSGMELLGLGIALMMLSSHESPAYRNAWAMIVLLLPVFGLLLYLMWGRGAMSNRERFNIRAAFDTGNAELSQCEAVMGRFYEQHPERVRMAKLLLMNHFPMYQGTAIEYFKAGELQFQRMFEDFERAERFIFLEFFIVADGKLLEQALDILFRKAGQGVDVRLLIDDTGCLFSLRPETRRRITQAGIKLERFNPMLRYISNLYFNYRNHQKIVVIDGNIGYTGGTNLADEYANLTKKHGYWKDTALRLEGEAVWSLTVFFLQMWDTARHSVTGDFTPYRPVYSMPGVGFIQPMSDGPALDPNNPGEDAYKELISSAKRYVYITTPYLVIDYSLVDILCRAASSGVDVRIVTPSHTDHWYVFIVTRSFYRPLLKAGVRVYEYQPGFIHAKMLVCDDDQAMVGTINMDYRSFNLQYEDSVYICGDPIVDSVKADINDIFLSSHEITLEEWSRRPFYTRWVSGVFNLFAPLM